MNASAPLSNTARDKLARSGASNISNSLLKRGLRNTFLLGLQPLEPSQAPLVGPAFTMRFIPAREDLDSMALYQRNDSLHRRAIEECPANAVLVMSTGNDTRVSCMGDMMALRLKMRGVAGVVTDGGFRDSPASAAPDCPASSGKPPGRPRRSRCIRSSSTRRSAARVWRFIPATLSSATPKGSSSSRAISPTKWRTRLSPPSSTKNSSPRICGVDAPFSDSSRRRLKAKPSTNAGWPPAGRRSTNIWRNENGERARRLEHEVAGIADPQPGSRSDEMAGLPGLRPAPVFLLEASCQWRQHRAARIPEGRKYPGAARPRFQPVHVLP